MTDEEPRPKNPTRAQLRQAVQPDEVMARAAEHWTGTLYMRRLSVNLTYLLVRTSITANGVTVLMILFGVLAGPALLLPGIWGRCSLCSAPSCRCSSTAPTARSRGGVEP